MSSYTVYNAEDVDGLLDGLPGRQYKQDAPFWVYVALQDWLREDGNANLLAYDSSDSIRTYPYPTHSTGERLSPREIHYLFDKPPAHVASQLPHCYCPAVKDDGSTLVRSFVVRKQNSPRVGEYGLTCARRDNRCGYFVWLSDVHQAPVLDVAPVGTGMLAHIARAERRDAKRTQKLEEKKLALKMQGHGSDSDYGTSSSADASSDAYSSEPESLAIIASRAEPTSRADGLLAAHGRPYTPSRAKRAVSPPTVDYAAHGEEPISKRARYLAPYDHLRRSLRLCLTHYVRHVRPFQGKESEKVYSAMLSLASPNPLPDFEGLVGLIRKEGSKEAQNWLDEKESSDRCGLRALYQPMSYIPSDIWKSAPSSTNARESAQGRDILSGKGLNLVGGIITAWFDDRDEMQSLSSHLSFGISRHYTEPTASHRAMRSLVRNAKQGKRTADEADVNITISTQKISILRGQAVSTALAVDSAPTASIQAKRQRQHDSIVRELEDETRRLPALISRGSGRVDVQLGQEQPSQALDLAVLFKTRSQLEQHLQLQTVQLLKVLCKGANLLVSGRKSELIERLLNQNFSQESSSGHAASPTTSDSNAAPALAHAAGSVRAQEFTPPTVGPLSLQEVHEQHQPEESDLTGTGPITVDDMTGAPFIPALDIPARTYESIMDMLLGD